MTAKVLVIGGGWSGVTLAYMLRRQNPELAVTLVEKGKTLGGSLSTTFCQSSEFPDRSYLFECGDPFVRQMTTPVCSLLEKLRMEKHLHSWKIPTGRRVGCGYSYRYTPRHFNPGIANKFDPIQWVHFHYKRMRYLRESRIPPTPLSDMSVADFVERRFGPEDVDMARRWAFRCRVEHGGEAENLSMRACFPEDWKKEQLYRSLIEGDKAVDMIVNKGKRTEFGKMHDGLPYVSFPGGMRTLIDALEADMTSTDFRNTVVERLNENADTETILNERQRWKHFSTKQIEKLMPGEGEFPDTSHPDLVHRRLLSEPIGPPVRVLTGAAVDALDFYYTGGDRPVGAIINGKEERFDHVYSTVKSWQLAEILSQSSGGGVPESVLEDLLSIKHASTVRVCLGWPDQALDHVWLGFRSPQESMPIVPQISEDKVELYRQMMQTIHPPPVNFDRKSPVLAVFNDSGMFPQLNKVGADETRLSLILGGAGHPEIADMDAQGIVRIAREYIRDKLGIKEMPDAIHIHRNTQEHPQFEVGHQELVDRIERATLDFTPHFTISSKSLHGVGFSSGLLLNEQLAVELGETVVHDIHAEGDPDTEGLAKLRNARPVDVDFGYEIRLHRKTPHYHL
eukprot:263993_1